MRHPRRVAITGIGCITPVGIGAGTFWKGLQACRTAVGLISRFDTSGLRSRLAAEVADFHPADHLPRKQVQRLERYSQFAVAATRLALSDAGIDPSREDSERVGVYMGSALGGVGYAEDQCLTFLQEGLRKVDPLLALSVFGGAASCNVAISFGFTGPNETNAMSCAAGAIALRSALAAIRRGDADVVLAGGAEAPLNRLTYSAFTLIRAMSTRNDAPQTACRPFDAERDGFVMGEGAAVLVLEELGRARARGARIYAELAGAGLTNDAHHMTSPRPDAAQSARAIRLALADAQMCPSEVGYINAHASATRLNDGTEARAIHDVLGPVLERIAVSGTKGYYGHPLGASGAIEAAICALSLHHGWLPPTVGCQNPDPDCRLHLITGQGKAQRPGAVLSNSFGFGGINCTLALRAAGA